MNQQSVAASRYVVISPCRDEMEYMKRTLDSMVAQSKTPDLWLIVDDGSTDGSSELLDSYAEKHSFIEVVRREDRGYRMVGPGVVDAFYSGYKTINPDDFDFICKLDLDLDVPPKYFEILITRMVENPRLGTCSGKPYNEINGDFVSEKRGDEHSVGMTKFFRMSCFIQIGGFIRQVNWDAIDCHKARQFGWMVRSWDEPDLRFAHLRMMGSSQHSIYTGKMRYGFGQYFMGTSLVYLLATAAFRVVDKPYLLGSLAVVYGYLKSRFSGDARLDDEELIRYIRRFQWTSLLKGKNKTIDIFEAESKSNWDVNKPPIPMPVNGENEQ